MLGTPQGAKKINIPALGELLWNWALGSVTVLSPGVFSPSIKAQLLSQVFPDHPGNSSAVEACVIDLALSLCSVNCFLYFYSSLWLPQLDLGQPEGWERHENGDHGFCLCGFPAPNTALHRAAHRVMLCTPNRPTLVPCLGATSHPSSLLWLPGI